ESVLNQTVWDALVQAILNPQIIAEQVEKLHFDLRSHQTPVEVERREVENGLMQLENEESRLLEAYRLAVITASQLNQELGKLRSRKVILTDRQAEIERNLSTPAVSVIRKTLFEYCER